MLMLLCIMDGFGLREPTPDNAVALAHKPTFDRLMASCPHATLDGSGPAVGLPPGQMGNSEVGHLNLGAGRIIHQDITRIDQAIADGSFSRHPQLVTSFERVGLQGKAVHLVGLVSDGCVHASLNHLAAHIETAQSCNVENVYIHAITDGRDTPPNTGLEFVRGVERVCGRTGIGRVVTVGGRYFAMDRDKRWERIELAARAIVFGEGERFSSASEAISASYAAGVTDEFIKPAVITPAGSQPVRMADDDLVIHFNFRADRARQLCRLFVHDPTATGTLPELPAIELVTLTNYDITLHQAKPLFQPVRHRNLLGEVIARAGLKQLRTAETEKYAHVTYFFNGGEEQQFVGEERDLIPSPKVATYDLQPEMSAPAVTANAVKRIKSDKYGLIVLNYANPDMVGHTGVIDAARRAVEAVDKGLGELLEAVRAQKGCALVTADHGNAEQMIDPATGGPWTAHTTNLVPVILFDPLKRLGEKTTLRSGILADIAPTILEALGIAKPSEMTGSSLLVRG